jgi:tetratricopeptide (TPR) repeat protein
LEIAIFHSAFDTSAGCDSVNPNAFADMTFFSRSRAKSRVFVTCFLLLILVGCKKAATSEEKTLRVQLSHELRHHSYDKAVPIARHLIELAPQDNNIWKRLVQAQLGLHDLDGVKQTLAEWRKTVRSPTPRLDEYEGDLARESGDLPRARQAWDKVLAAQPKNRRVLEKIALLEQSEQRWAEAIALWSRLLKIRDDATGWINLAVCQRRLRDWDHAFQDLHRAQQLGSDDPEVQHWSKLFEKLSKFLDQIRELDAKVAAMPDDAGLLAERALLLLRAGDPELAFDDCEMASALAPWAVRPKLFQAVALIALNRSNECERLSIRQPLRLEAMTPEFLETMSRLDSAISVERTNPEHFAGRSWQLNEIGQPMLALKDAETAARLDEKSASACAEVSYSLMKLGRTKQAFEKIKRATELDPNLGSAWQYRGELEMAAGDNLAAIESLSHALGIQQTVAGLQKREECYRRVGLRARADEDHRALQQLTAHTFK